MIILASKSPRRFELIHHITDEVCVLESGFDENSITKRSPKKLCRALAVGKASYIDAGICDVVIGCDTVVAYGKEIFGKPVDYADAVRMLSRLSGNTHKVITGVCLKKGKKQVVFSVTTRVTFRRLSQKEIEEYAKTDEPYDKAGGYGIQSDGSRFVEQVWGSYTNVIGMPVRQIAKRLKRLL